MTDWRQCLDNLPDEEVPLAATWSVLCDRFHDTEKARNLFGMTPMHMHRKLAAAILQHPASDDDMVGLVRELPPDAARALHAFNMHPLYCRGVDKGKSRLPLGWTFTSDGIRCESQQTVDTLPQAWIVHASSLSAAQRESLPWNVMDDALQAFDLSQRALECYTDGSQPTHYTCEHRYQDFVAQIESMRRVTVYWSAQHVEGGREIDISEVEEYLDKRYPCAMGDVVLTDTTKMKEYFGVDRPLYCTLNESPPMVGVLCPDTEVWIDGRWRTLTVYHAIGPDLNPYGDGSPTADMQTLDRLVRSSKSMYSSEETYYAMARLQAPMWYLIFKAAHDAGFKKVSRVMVGGGSFAPRDMDPSVFRARIHDVALQLIGYDQPDFPFPDVRLVSPPDFVPDSLSDYDSWKDVLHINAWCHSSFLGNGNRKDDTLDGGWGRIANFALHACPQINKWMQFRKCDVPSTPEERPKLARKPPARREREEDGDTAKKRSKGA